MQGTVAAVAAAAAVAVVAIISRSAFALQRSATPAVQAQEQIESAPPFPENSKEFQ